MEKNNVVDEVIEYVEKDGKLKDRAIKKIKKDNDISAYMSNFISLVIGLLIVLIFLELPEIIGYFYIDNYNALDVVYEVIYVLILLILLIRNYITFRKINSKR